MRTYKNILVSGSLAYDRIMDFGGRFRDHLLPGKLHLLSVSFPARTFRESFGGTAGNIAYSLSLLGERPVVLATYGHDFGRYAPWCRQHRIDLSASRRIGGEPTESVFIITDQEDNQINSFFAGAAAKRNGPVPQRLLGPGALAVVAPGNTGDMCAYPAQYRRTRTPYVFDPGQQITSLSSAQLAGALRGAYGFISNDYELSMVLRKTKWPLAKLKRQVPVVVTTKGARGSEIFNGGRRIVVPPAKPKNTCDPTGAGDAYRAGLLKGLCLGLPLARAGRLASVVSVYSVETYGTQTHRFSWADVRRRYARNFGERL